MSKEGKEIKGRGGITARGGFQWIKAVNDKATDETTAHMSMFFPRDNPGFYALGESAKECLSSWIDQGWYRASSGPSFLGKGHGFSYGEVGDGWEKPDYDAEETRAKERERDRYGKYRQPEDWDSVHVRHGQDELDSDDGDVRMRDEDHAEEDLEDSVIVERASNGEMPLPKPRGNTGVEKRP